MFYLNLFNKKNKAMKFIKITLIGILALLATYLLFCAIGISRFQTSRSILIDAGAEQIFAEISDYQKWPAWSPWAQRDKNMQNEYSGAPGIIGHKNTWKSITEGNGTQEMIEVKTNAYVKSKLVFTDWDGATFTELILSPEGDKTKVTWTMQGSDFPFIARGFIYLMGGNKMIEKDYDEGLANLKKLVESTPKSPAFAYEIVELPEIIYVGIRMKVNVSKITGDMFNNSYQKITAAIGKNTEIAGMPFSITHSFDQANGDMEMEMAMPVKSEIKVSGELACNKIPAGKCAKHIYTGPYEGTEKQWPLFFNEVYKKHKPRFPGYEVYANDPATVKSPANYITWLMIPVE
jgi:effector-binding domain-containing protein